MTRELRDKDREVLHQIEKGNDDVQKITSATTLENHEVNYCFDKLEQLDLIQVEKPGGMVERMIDGQKRVFQHPKQATLTEKGQQYLEHADRGDLDEYENLSHQELVEKTHKLEDRVNQLENQLQTFKQQFQGHIS